MAVKTNCYSLQLDISSLLNIFKLELYYLGYCKIKKINSLLCSKTLLYVINMLVVLCLNYFNDNVKPEEFLYPFISLSEKFLSLSFPTSLCKLQGSCPVMN